MKFGFIKVAAAVPHVRVGDCEYNLQQTKDLLIRAAKAGAEVVVFPELGLTGCTCGDLFHQTLLIESAEKALKDLLKQTARLSSVGVVGLPVQVENGLYNCAVLFQKGKILGVVPKTFLSNHGEFTEKRWFRSAEESYAEEIELAGQYVPFGTDLLFACQGVTLGAEIGADLSVPVPPSSLAALAGANIILNLSAEPELCGKNARLKSFILSQSARTLSGYVYASSGFGESSTDLVFGGNGFIAENGNLLSQAYRFNLKGQLILSEIDVEKLQALRRFSTTFGDDAPLVPSRVVDFELSETAEFSLSRRIDPTPFIPAQAARKESCEEILSIQAHGLMQRLAHTKCQKVVLGISGGLDSTLALLVVVKAFDGLRLNRKGIIGVTMPCFGTTDRTYQNALQMMKALKITSQEIDIKEACLQHLKDLKHSLSAKDVTYENAQARERTQVLMDLANQQGALVIGTGDLSELALGWATYNGDHMSMYGVNSGVSKTLVRCLVEYAAHNCQDKKLAAVLTDVLGTPVSPELLPPSGKKISQKTEDLVGPYELHDFYLYYFVRFGFSPKKIFWLATQAFDKKYSKAEIKKWLGIFLKRFFAQQFKRSCLPDGPKVGTVGLSPRGDWRMPSDAQAVLWLRQCEDL
ncbi:MAG: NAD(+) synthase [Elusimicrobiaceae bacterium]|nr:NAD(+) synthase [Elusimicrobiaceae bacterium]